VSLVTRALQQRGVDITEGTIRWWEDGRVGRPDQAVLPKLIDVLGQGTLEEAEAALADDISSWAP
jgi:hypothetical protein